MDWYVYMLRCADGSLYTGIAADVECRFEEHKSGRGAKYTRSHRYTAKSFPTRARRCGARLPSKSCRARKNLN